MNDRFSIIDDMVRLASDKLVSERERWILASLPDDITDRSYPWKLAKRMHAIVMPSGATTYTIDGRPFLRVWPPQIEEDKSPPPHGFETPSLII